MEKDYVSDNQSSICIWHY